MGARPLRCAMVWPGTGEIGTTIGGGIGWVGWVGNMVPAGNACCGATNPAMPLLTAPSLTGSSSVRAAGPSILAANTALRGPTDCNTKPSSSALPTR